MWTVRTWRRKSLKDGRIGLACQMGRPATGPMSTFPKELQQAILHVRKLHPGWGSAMLLATLQLDAYWCDQPLPSRAHIARLLKQAGLTRQDLPHHDLAQLPRTQLTAPHQQWQMDAASDHAVEGGSKVRLISIVDVVSHRHRPKAIRARIRPIRL